MSNKNVSIFLIVALLFTACSQPENSDNSDVQSYQQVNLQSVYQRTLRYDCSNNLYSDAWERLKSPMQNLKLQVAKPTAIWRSSYYNRTTDSYAKTVNNHSEFSIDYYFDYNSMHVSKGLNLIEYSYEYCEFPVDADEDCPQIQSVKRSNFYLKISYTENRLPEVRKIFPDPSQCE